MNERKTEGKKLKKELDFIKNQPIKRNVYKITNIELKHLKAYRIFNVYEIEQLGEEVIEDEARNQLAFEFLKYIKENMIVNKDRDLDRFTTMKYSTDIWISFGRK